MWSIAVIEHQGSREYMEDRYVINPDFYKGYSLFAVFDGHGGDAAAEFCKEKLEGLLHQHLMQTDNIPQALNDVFLELDDKLPVESGYMTGTTAVVILKHVNHLWVAHAGDSRAMINLGIEGIAITHDHKPHRADELQRIQEHGGFVSQAEGDVPRVIGNLAVSRSIGDRASRPFVIPNPQISRVNMSSQNKFMVIGTDGLWDLFSCQDVNNIINTFYHNPTFSDKMVLELSTQALDTELHKKGMHDNTTVLIVHMRR